MADSTETPDDMNSQMTSAEVKEIAREAARETVDNLFLHLGYDIAGEGGANELRAIAKDLRHTRRWREATETVQKQGLIAATVIIVGGVLGLIWVAVTRGQ